ncbi:sensor histidine kinase [Actinoplanes philippinensis]|uniref:sensor histidine kinase n=1 Tax=Actinoplanes philippinensis TaxID=35752 RepID=UPI0033DE5EE4
MGQVTVAIADPGDPFAGTALSRLGHELRGPLAGIIGLTKIMGRKLADGATDAAQQARQLDMINNSAAELLATVERIVTLARTADAGRRLEPVDCRAVCEQAVTATAAAADQHHRGVRLQLPPSPVSGLANHDDLRDAVTELLDNAVKYADGPCVRLTVHADGPAIEISDDGPGLADDERERVFLPFERGHAARAGDIAGTGLGLPLAVRHARRCDAGLAVRTGSAGTTCTLTLAPLVTGH